MTHEAALPAAMPHLAPQFESPAQQALTAKLGMWAFLATEMLFFGGAFAGYGLYRWRYPEAWTAASGHLDLTLGAVNTAVLLGSSLTMALAVDAARQSRTRALLFHLAATIVLGGAFLVIKAFEYAGKWHDRLVPGPYFVWHGEEASGQVQLFYSFYFALTGCHAVHMIIGLVLLAIQYRQAQRGRFSADFYTPVEMMGLYWHFVDCVWVVLFPLLYLIDRS